MHDHGCILIQVRGIIEPKRISLKQEMYTPAHAHSYTHVSPNKKKHSQRLSARKTFVLFFKAYFILYTQVYCNTEVKVTSFIKKNPQK